MKPFLLLQSRPEDAASDGEFESFKTFGDLDNTTLLRLRVENGDLPNINLDKYSGIIIGGGPYNVSDDMSKKTLNQITLEKKLFSLLDTVVEKDFPFLGVCYGIGLLGSHQNGTVSQKYAEEVAPTRITLNKQGTLDPLLEGLDNSFYAVVGHKEACEQLPNSAVLLASSKNCPVQMYRVKNNIYVTQFHPELDSKALETRLRVYQHAGYFHPDDLDDVIQRGYSVELTEPIKIVKNFIRRYQQPN